MSTKGEREIAVLEALLAGDDPGASTACPEPAVLMSLGGDGRHADARDAEMRMHVATCQSCADFVARLRSFDEGAEGQAAAAAEREWVMAEPRLDHWMANYLALQQRGSRAHEQKIGAGLGLVARRFAWVRWGLPIAAGVCAAALVGVVESRKGSDSPVVETERVAAAPAIPPGGSGGAESGIGKDGTVLTSNGQEGAGSSAVAGPLRFVGDEVLTVKVTAVAALADGRSRVSGSVLSSTVGQDSLVGTELSGVFVADGAEHGPRFAVEQVERNEVSYLPSPVPVAADERPFALTVSGGESGLRVGDAVQMKVPRDQMYVVMGP